MISRVRAAAAVAATMLLLMGLQAGPVGAHAVDDRSEGGPLDIKRLEHALVGSGSIAHTITMHRAFDSEAFLGGLLGLRFTDAKGSRDSRRTILVGLDGGELRAYQYGPNGRSGEAGISRPSSSSIRIVVSKKFLGASSAYRWSAASASTSFPCQPSCFDVAPNGGRGVLHDFVPPRIKLGTFPDPTTERSATTSFKVSFTVSDNLAIARWTVERRLRGTGTWSVAAAGRGAGKKSPSIRGQQGKTYDLRVAARDTGGNVTTSKVKTVSVPLDDSAEALLYDPALWTAQTAQAGNYLGTLHTATVGASVRYSFTGSYFALIAPAGDGVAVVGIDGQTETVDFGGITGKRRVVYERTLTEGPHEVLIAVVDGTVSLDGLVSR